MLGLDTSVAVRLLVGLPQGIAKKARRRLESAVETGARNPWGHGRGGRVHGQKGAPCVGL